MVHSVCVKWFVFYHSEVDGLRFLDRALADIGHTLISAGAFVFDDDDDYLSGDKMDKDRLRVEVVSF